MGDHETRTDRSGTSASPESSTDRENGDSQVGNGIIAKFGQVEMTATDLAKLSQDPSIVAAVEKKAAVDAASAANERVAPALDKLSTLVTKLLAATQLTPADLNRIRFTIADDGKCYAEYKVAGRSRNGQPSERFGGFTQSVLKAHGVKRFVKLGQHGKLLAEASDGAGICTVEGIPFAGQAKHDADANHKSAGCDRAKCTTVNHGDNADRLTYAQRGVLGADGGGIGGWHVEHADGKREKLAALEWDTVP